MQRSRTSVSNDTFKINVSDRDQHRRLINAHREENKKRYFTYEGKQNWPIKLMVRGLHRTCNPKMITEDFLHKNLHIKDVVNITKKEKIEDNIVRKPLHLFMLTFAKFKVKRNYEINTRILG